MLNRKDLPNLLQTVLRGSTGEPILGIVYRPADYEFPGRERAGPWRRHLLANAAPRDAGYMEALFRGHFPDTPLMTLDDRPARSSIGDAKIAVLLFPDAIGLDFGRIERLLDSWNVRMVGLNGRGRFFPLDAHNRRRLCLRRLLERTRAPEFAFLLVAIIATPAFVLIDLARGRR